MSDITANSWCWTITTICSSTNRGYEWGCQWCESDGQEIEAPHQDPPCLEVVILLLAPRLVTVESKEASAPRRYPRHSCPRPPLLSQAPSSCRSLAALGNAWLSLYTGKPDRRIKQRKVLKAWRYHRLHGGSLDKNSVEAELLNYYKFQTIETFKTLSIAGITSI